MFVMCLSPGLRERESLLNHLFSTVIIFQDIVENEDIKLDNMFIASLVHDLIKVGCIIVIVDTYLIRNNF